MFYVRPLASRKISKHVTATLIDYIIVGLGYVTSQVLDDTVNDEESLHSDTFL